MEKKKGIIITGITLLLLLVVGVTYAFFTYESGTKSDIVTGQIYMNYEETSTISLTGVFPETKEQALARNDENGVFEFTITGRNTSKYPVYYEIDLLEGGVITGKTEQSTKILPEHVMIYLERDGEPLVDGMTYKGWNNRRIYVDTVPANQTSNIEHKYTLRMWIDENVTISDTDPNADYTTTEWNDAYTSLKVRVVGDFEEKELATDASCFAYNVITPDGYIVYDYPIITLDTSDEKVEACMANMMGNFGEDLSTAQDGYQSFCEGTGTFDFNGTEMTLQDFANFGLSQGVSKEEVMQSLPVVSNITIETSYYELNTSEESVNACKEYMTELRGGDYSDAQDGYLRYCEGTGTIDEYSIIKDIEDGIYEIDILVENNVLTQVETPQGGEIEITNYDEETCGTDVIIPSTIEGLPVTRIADEYSGIPATQMNVHSNNLTNDNLYNKNANYSIKPIADRKEGVFQWLPITSVKFPNTLNYIGYKAFQETNLTEVIIPDSVTAIMDYAFNQNSITNVEIGTGITSIGAYAFEYNPLVIVNIKNNPSLGLYSLRASNYEYDQNFELFQYGGTCEELNQNADVFATMPQQIITTDNNACKYIAIK